MSRAAPRNFVPLDQETRYAVDTETAAYHLNRAPKTLRTHWGAGNGPIQPQRINGRLHWPVAAIRSLLSKGDGGLA